MAEKRKLSDGEIESSEEDGEVKSKVTKCVEERSDKETVDNRQDSEEWQVVVKGPRKRKIDLETQEMVNKKKKKRKRSIEVLKEDAMAQLAEDISCKRTYLNSSQKELLHHLCHLMKGGAKDTGLPQYKTTDLQAVLRHVLIGEPGLSKKVKLKKSREFQDKRIVVIWMSNVSSELFSSSEKYFKQLKSFPSQIKFMIQHPGSDRFARFGLEAFMEIEDASQTKELPKNFKVSPSFFTRKHCMVDSQQLVANGFPSPDDSANNEDCSNFFKLTPWPVGSDAIVSDEASTYPMFSIDCEMVKVDTVYQLASVSVINEQLECVYHTLVKPDGQITDYLTQFSGIDQSMLADVTTRLEDVQIKLSELLPSKCILIGHSLENDLLSLKLMHPYVIDTSLLFTPNATPRFKISLRQLTKKVLNREIQCGEKGHSPTEDAVACMELVLKKLEEGPKLIVPWNDHKISLPYLVSSHNLETTLIDKKSVVAVYGGGLTATVGVACDELAIDTACEAVIDSKFLFVQLHGMEKYLKEEEKQSERTLMSVVDTLDSLAGELITTCPPESLILVVCGSSYITEVRRLQKSVTIDHALLKKEVLKAREGMVVALLK